MSTLTRNILYNTFGQTAILLLGFFSVKYTFDRLGKDELGIIFFTIMLNALLNGVFEMGVSRVTIREISAHHKNEPEYIKKLVRMGSLVYWCMFAAASVSLYLLAPAISSRWLMLETMSTETATHILRILGIASLVAIPKTFYDSLFRGIQRMEFNNIIEVSTTALQHLGIIVILACGGTLMQVVYWMSSCYLLRLIAYFVLSAHFFSAAALVPGFSPEVIRRVKDFFLNTMAITVLSLFHAQADKIITSKFLPISFVGYFGVVSTNVNRSQIFVNAISQSAYPSLSELFRNGTRNSLMKQYEKLHDLLCFGTVPVLALIPFAAIPLFSYMLNAETAAVLLLPATLMTIAVYMIATLTVPYIFSLAVGKPEIAARQNFYALFVVLPATFFLIYYGWLIWGGYGGLVGAGLAKITYYLFAYFYSMPRVCSECLLIPSRRWFGNVFKIYLLIAAAYGPAWFVQSAVGGNSIPSLAAGYLSGTAVFLAASYFMVGAELRKALFENLHNIKARIAGAGGSGSK